MPRVTVVMATYNWSSVLPYSIASVLEQTFTDFELLVTGDGCTDDSEQVVKSIGDPRIRWLNLPRFGHQSGPNNEGIRQARGEYIAYLGHDDLWLPQHLSELVAALDGGADIAHTVLAAVDPKGMLEPSSGPPTSMGHRRSMTDRIGGGWADYRRITVLPEEDWWRRIREAGLKSTFVQRCTGVKFPAAWRRNVYRERPFHEQAAWLARIRSEPDLGMTLLVEMAFRRDDPPMWVRVPRLLLRPWRWPAAVMRRLPLKGAPVRRFLRIKGVTG